MTVALARTSWHRHGAPTHDFEKLINNAVDPDNVDTFLRQFVETDST